MLGELRSLFQTIPRAVFVFLALAACAPRTAQGEMAAGPVAADIAFPRQPPSEVYMQALAGGRLILDRGCLRLTAGETSNLVVWPSTAELLTPDETGAIGVRDATSGAVVRVGDGMLIGGGQVSGGEPYGMEEPILARCEGPYWMGAPGFHMVAPDDWRAVILSSPITVRLPVNLTPKDITPIDTQVYKFERSGLTLIFDYGALACGVPGETPGYASSRETIYVGQRRGDVIRKIAQDGEDQMLDAMFTDLDGPAGVQPPQGRICLGVMAQCATGRDCDVARAILDTIRFEG
jgi:hypothetical protein